VLNLELEFAIQKALTDPFVMKKEPKRFMEVIWTPSFVTLAFSTALRSLALKSCPKLRWFTVWLRLAIEGLKLWFTERALTE